MPILLHFAFHIAFTDIILIMNTVFLVSLYHCPWQRHDALLFQVLFCFAVHSSGFESLDWLCGSLSLGEFSFICSSFLRQPTRRRRQSQFLKPANVRVSIWKGQKPQHQFLSLVSLVRIWLLARLLSIIKCQNDFEFFGLLQKIAGDICRIENEKESIKKLSQS